MYHLETSDEWESIHIKDLWVYNKLILSRSLGYLCGPTGVSVPIPNHYIVRPSINFLGMGRFSRMEWISNETDHFHPSEFWCERFYGEHISVDFKDKESKLTVIGERHSDNPLYKWKKWIKIDKKVEFPAVLNDLVGNYEYINCEFIGDKLIEVHFRQNPDFRYGNTIAIPVWKGEKIETIKNLSFVRDEDYLREGFYVDFGIETP
jgi:hypothetical protein